MKKVIFGFILLSIISVSALAGGEKKNATATSKRISVSGFVQDFESSEKLVCAKIEIPEINKILYTDILGNYTIEDIKPGVYTIIVSYISYQELELKSYPLNNLKELNIQLKPL